MKLIRKILKGVSLTAAMFVFQACYGTMDDYYQTKVTFHVVDKDSGEPLEGVRIWEQSLNTSDSSDIGNARYIADYTDENGMATIWANDGIERFTFIDKDSIYIPFDTIFNPLDVDTVDIVLEPLR